MKQNMGTTDRILRAIGGLVLIILYFANVITGGLGIAALVIAAVLLLTALVGFCPLYVPFRIHTRQV
jgi:hypothetical protein